MGSADGAAVEDVTVQDAWERLAGDQSAMLIDVRTKAEWAFVGGPDLSRLGKRVITVEWQSFPDNRIDPAFVERLAEALGAAGASKDAELLFICRSGGRSRMAAATTMAAGYPRCRNVMDGFEGPLDESRHRGAVGGWKFAGLPWVQG